MDTTFFHESKRCVVSEIQLKLKFVSFFYSFIKVQEEVSFAFSCMFPKLCKYYMIVFVIIVLLKIC